MKTASRKASSGHPLRDAAWLVFLLILAASVRFGGPDEKLDLDLGSAHAADPRQIELNAPAIVEDEDPACPSPAQTTSAVWHRPQTGEKAYHIVIVDDSAFPRLLSLPTTPESPRQGCCDQNRKDRLSC